MSNDQASRFGGLRRKTAWLTWIAVFAAMVALGGASTCSVTEGVLVSCDDTDDCQYELPGTLCVAEICTCPNANEQFCYGSCRPYLECRPDAGAAGGGDAGVSGGECKTAADCPQAGHPRCGTATCDNGVCGLKVKLFGPLPSQVFGDCKEIWCDGDGNMFEFKEGTDVYDDGRQCTFNLCEGGEPVNMDHSPMHGCSENGGQFCYEGDGRDCVDGVGGFQCGGGSACDGVYCVPPHCNNNVYDQNLGETDVNCGGPCRPCFVGDSCNTKTDCLEGVCSSGVCLAPTCSDKVRNGFETDIDCGGDCPRCSVGKGCKVPSECESDVCWTGVCQPPTCTDGIKNGDETDWDCGGSCAPCP